MAKIEGRSTIGVAVVLVLTEAEAGALDALAGYDTDAFIKTFYEKMGRAYLEPYEVGLRSLLDSVRDTSGIRLVLSRLRDARLVFNGEKVAVSPKVVA